MKYGTPFVETEAILAAQEGDTEELDRLMSNMLPGELMALSSAAQRLAERADSAWRRRRDEALEEVLRSKPPS